MFHGYFLNESTFHRKEIWYLYTWLYRFSKLDSDHVRYVIDCSKNNVTQVDNIRAYLLTAMYNALGTIENYYQAWVNYDMYGRGVWDKLS